MAELPTRFQRSTAGHMAFCVSGIMGSLIMYSILQARQWRVALWTFAQAYLVLSHFAVNVWQAEAASRNGS